MDKEIIYELSGILSHHWDEIIEKFNKHFSENFSKLYLQSFREYTLDMKTQDKTPLISGIFNTIMCIVLKDYGFTRRETDGYDFIYKTIKIEGKNTTSLDSSWTGNGYNKTNCSFNSPLLMLYEKSNNNKSSLDFLFVLLLLLL